MTIGRSAAVRLSLEFSVNGEHVRVEVEPRERLLEVLRRSLGLLGTKEGCGYGECGACTVLLDRLPVASCLVLAVMARGREVTTIEGLGRDGHPSLLQQAFVEFGALQCGFCTPGILISLEALMAEQQEFSRADLHRALAGNICRCTGYRKIEEAALAALETRSHGYG